MKELSVAEFQSLLHPRTLTNLYHIVRTKETGIYHIATRNMSSTRANAFLYLLDGRNGITVPIDDIEVLSHGMSSGEAVKVGKEMLRAGCYTNPWETR